MSECEPYITDYRLMLGKPIEILKGVDLVKALDTNRFFGIEAKKMQ